MGTQSANLPERRKDLPLEAETEHVWTPRADVQEGENGATLFLDMPGVDEKTLDIRVERNVLTVSAKLEGLQPDNRNLRVREFGNGCYRRIFTLSDELDIETIDASIKNGVLSLNVPKARKAQSRKIEVKSR